MLKHECLLSKVFRNRGGHCSNINYDPTGRRCAKDISTLSPGVAFTHEGIGPELAVTRMAIHWVHPGKTIGSHSKYPCRICSRLASAHSGRTTAILNGGANVQSHENAVAPHISCRASFRGPDRYRDVISHTVGICSSRILGTPLQTRAPLYARSGTRLRASRDRGWGEASPAGSSSTAARHSLQRI